MKTSAPLLFSLVVLFLLCLAVRRNLAENAASPPDTSIAGETAALEGRGEAGAVQSGRGGPDQDNQQKDDQDEDNNGELAAAMLPKPEALQGSLGALPAGQAAPRGTHQTLHGLNFGRIPASCALCSRERNLCRIISGIFTRSPLPYGYSLVTPVPAGVCNLTITEMKPSKNYFALRRSDGTYILNGNWDIKTAGEYEAGGTTFIYTPGSEEHGERLSAPGPLREPVDFMLISQSPNPGIEYEYRVPLPEYGAGKPPTVGLPSGSRPGLGGRVVAGVPGSRVVSSPGQRRPFQGSPNLASRTPSYGTRNPGQGTAFRFGPGTAGRPGDTFMPLTPVLQPVIGVGSSSGFNSSNVSLYPRNPQTGLGANPADTPRRWTPYLGVSQGSSIDAGSRTTGRLPAVIPRGQPTTSLGTSRTGSLPRPWSPGLNPSERGRASTLPGSPFLQPQPFPRGSGGSAASSGGVGKGFPGRKRGEVIVSAENNGRNGRPRPALTPSRDSELSVGGRQTLFKATNHHRGQGGKVTTGTPLSTHRTRHGHGVQGTQSRRKVPEKSSQFPVFDPDVQLTQPNASVQPTTNTTDSGNSQGRGNRERHRHRHQQNGSRRTGKKRRKDRTRVRGGGRFQWAEKGLTPCSRPCGGGNQTAILSCERKRNKRVVSDRRCAQLPRPEARFVLCNLSPCPAEWMPGEWGPCSVTCGMGVQTRPTVCKQVLSPTLTMMVPEGACLSPPTVATSQVCKAGPCSSTSPTWEAGSWSNCSAPCGLGTRSRQVSCTVEGVDASDDSCDLSARPVREEVCDMGSCATNTWFFSAWSEQCSEPCGAGVQTRRVHCLAGDSQASCPASERPDASRPCTGRSACGGQWFVGSWSECSKPCGAGRETRPVLCVLHAQTRWKVVEDSQCQANERPLDNRACNLESCTPVWYTSSWSQCSASCGGGIMRREVTCLDVLRHASPDCDNTTKPDARRPCHLHTCSDAAPRPVHAPTANNDPAAAVPRSPQPSAAPSSPTDDEDTEADDNTPSRVTGQSTYTTEAGRALTADEREEAVKEEKEEENESPLKTVTLEEEGVEQERETENELLVEEATERGLNTLPGRHAQGDESFADEGGEEEEKLVEGEDEEEEEEEQKKRKKKRKKERKKNKDRRAKGNAGGSSASNRRVSAAPERPLCIDRIKNCHLVFRARLCRLKYYNKLCCRTCTAT